MDASDRKRKRKRAERRRAAEEQRRVSDPIRKTVKRVERPRVQALPDPFAERQTRAPAYVAKKRISSYYSGLMDALREVADLSRKAPVKRYSLKPLDIIEAVKPALAMPDKPENRGPQHAYATESRLTMARAFSDKPDRVDHSPKRVRETKNCKPRPDNTKPRSGHGGGGSPKRFIPWCNLT